MAEVINLNKARKARGRAHAKVTAAQNRIRHGRPGGEKAAARLDEERARRDLEGKKRED